MIDKKKKLKPEVGRLALLLFSAFIFICLATTPAVAQNCDNKTGTWISKISAGDDKTIFFSQVTSDSLGSVIPDCSKGMSAMITFLKKNITYSSKAIAAKIQGDITVGFTVTKEGIIKNSQITKGLYPDLDKEVIQAIKRMPACELAEKNGQKVDMDYKITMKFSLPDGAPKISVVGVETKNLMLTVKTKDGAKMGTVTVHGTPDMCTDTIVTRTVTVVTQSTNGKMNVNVEEGSK